MHLFVWTSALASWSTSAQWDTILRNAPTRSFCMFCLGT